MIASNELWRSRLDKDAMALAHLNDDTNATLTAMTHELGFAAAFPTVPEHVATSADRFFLRRVDVYEEKTRTRSGGFCATAWTDLN